MRAGCLQSGLSQIWSFTVLWTTGPLEFRPVMHKTRQDMPCLAPFLIGVINLLSFRYYLHPLSLAGWLEVVCIEQSWFQKVLITLLWFKGTSARFFSLFHSSSLDVDHLCLHVQIIEHELVCKCMDSKELINQPGFGIGQFSSNRLIDER